MPPSSVSDNGGTSMSSSAPPSASSADPNLSPSESQYVLDGCISGCRVDGRGAADYRPYALDSRSRSLPPSSSGGDIGGGGGATTTLSSVVEPPLVLSHGSSRVSLPGGEADILCSVRAELVRPSPSSPSRGSVDVRVEMLHPAPPGSSSRGRRRAEEAELTSALSRLVAPRAADWDGLCVVPGRYAWRLACDVSVLCSDGSALDASAMALRAAVRGTLLPRVTAVEKASGGPSSSSTADKGGTGKASDDLLVDGDMADAAPPPGADDCPVVVTVSVLESSASGGGGSGKGGRKGSRTLILDARTEEEKCASTTVAVGVDRAGRICGVYKRGSSSAGAGDGGGGTLPLAVLGEVAAAASEGARRVLRMTDGEGNGCSSERDKTVGVAGGGGVEEMLGGHLVIR